MKDGDKCSLALNQLAANGVLPFDLAAPVEVGRALSKREGGPRGFRQWHSEFMFDYDMEGTLLAEPRNV